MYFACEDIYSLCICTCYAVRAIFICTGLLSICTLMGYRSYITAACERYMVMLTLLTSMLSKLWGFRKQSSRQISDVVKGETNRNGFYVQGSGASMPRNSAFLDLSKQ